MMKLPLNLGIEEVETLFEAAEELLDLFEVAAWQGRKPGGVLAVGEADEETGQAVIYVKVVNGRMYRDQEGDRPPANFLGVVLTKFARLLANLQLRRTSTCPLEEVRLGEAPFGGALRNGRMLFGFSGGPPDTVDEPVALVMLQAAIDVGLTE